MKNKRLRPFVLILCILALCGASLWGAWRIWFDPYRGTTASFRPTEGLQTLLSGPQGAQELDYIVRRLEERHPSCMDGLPGTVRAAYDRERGIIAASPEVTVLSLWQSAARILAALSDAHTAVGVHDNGGARMPFSFAWENGALLCSGGEYDGYAVVEIGGVPIYALYERFLAQFSYELEAWAQYSFAARLDRGEYLAFLGVDTQGGVSLTLKNPGGGAHITTAAQLRAHAPADTGEADRSFDYTLDPSAGVGIFTLRQCVYDDAYRAGLQAFFTEVEKQGIPHVIVDLRGNPGGNSLVANAFIRYLPAETYLTGSSEVRHGPILWKNKPRSQTNHHLSPVFSGNLYVLTGADSFSSAVDFAALISDNGLGTVVGETPGNMPSSYGDILLFQTPNTGLIFSVSYKYFVRPDASKRDLPLFPHVPVPAENALDEVLGRI